MILEILNYSQPDMLVVFIMSLLLVIPPLTVTVYLWTSVARFYEELKHYDKAIKHLSQKQRFATMRLVGNLIVTTPDQGYSITPRALNSNRKSFSVRSEKQNGVNNTIALTKLANSKDTRPSDHENIINII